MAVIKSVDDLGLLGEQELEELYTWIDSIPLSRPKRNIARDFSGMPGIHTKKKENRVPASKLPRWEL